MHFLENCTRIQTKIGNVYTRFQTETRKNHTLHKYKANIRKYPPGGPGVTQQCHDQWTSGFKTILPSYMKTWYADVVILQWKRVFHEL